MQLGQLHVNAPFSWSWSSKDPIVKTDVMINQYLLVPASSTLEFWLWGRLLAWSHWWSIWRKLCVELIIWTLNVYPVERRFLCIKCFSFQPMCLSWSSKYLLDSQIFGSMPLSLSEEKILWPNPLVCSYPCLQTFD